MEPTLRTLSNREMVVEDVRAQLCATAGSSEPAPRLESPPKRAKKPQ